MSRRIVIVCLLSIVPMWIWALNQTQATEVVNNYYQSLAMYAQNPASNPKLVTQWFTTDNVVFNDIYGALLNDQSSHNRCAVKDYVTYVGGYYNNYNAKLSISYTITGNVYSSTTSNGSRVPEYLVYVTKRVIGKGTKPINLTTYEELAVREIGGSAKIQRIVKKSAPYTSSSTTQTSTNTRLRINSLTFYNDPTGDFGSDMTETMYAYQMRRLRVRASIYNSGEAIKADIKVKIFKPDGSLVHGSSSPDNYTLISSRQVSSGTDNYYITGWGHDEKSTFYPGEYKYEVYWNNNLLYRTTFTIEKDKWYELLERVALQMTGGRKGTGIYPSSGNGYGMYISTKGSFEFGWMTSSGQSDGATLSIINPASHASNCSLTQFYFGSIVNGVKTGDNASCYDPNGKLIYYGSFSSDKPTGTYPMKSGNYSSYRFEMLERSNGAYYIGETKNHTPHGKGLFVWPSGFIWYGEMTDGNRDGRGILFYSNGTTKRGYWKKDEYSPTKFE